MKEMKTIPLWHTFSHETQTKLWHHSSIKRFIERKANSASRSYLNKIDEMKLSDIKRYVVNTNLQCYTCMFKFVDIYLNFARSMAFKIRILEERDSMTGHFALNMSFSKALFSNASTRLKPLT